MRVSSDNEHASAKYDAPSAKSAPAGLNSQDRVTQKAAPGRKIELPGAAFSQERVTAGLRVASAVLARSAVSVGCLDRAERGGSVRKAALGGEPEGARIGLSEPSQRALRTVAVRRM